MRLTTVTTVLSTAALFASSIATPVLVSTEKTPEKQEVDVIRRDVEPQKYFHEPGYVVD